MDSYSTAELTKNKLFFFLTTHLITVKMLMNTENLPPPAQGYSVL